MVLVEVFCQYISETDETYFWKNEVNERETTIKRKWKPKKEGQEIVEIN